MMSAFGQSSQGQPQSASSLSGELLDPQNSTVEEMFENLTEEQEEMLILAMRDLQKHNQQSSSA